MIEFRAAAPRQDVMAHFFDSAGRVARIGFVLKIGGLIAILAVYDHFARGEVRLLTGFLIEWPLFFSAACVISQRLHDCGRSGWWGAVVLLSFCRAWPQPHGGAGVAALILVSAAGLALGLWPGQPTFNRYGPRP